MVSSILNMPPPESGGTQELAKQNVKCSELHRDTACESSERNDKEVKAQQARKIRELGEARPPGFRSNTPSPSPKH